MQDSLRNWRNVYTYCCRVIKARMLWLKSFRLYLVKSCVLTWIFIYLINASVFFFKIALSWFDMRNFVERLRTSQAEFWCISLAPCISCNWRWSNYLLIEKQKWLRWYNHNQYDPCCMIMSLNSVLI